MVCKKGKKVKTQGFHCKKSEAKLQEPEIDICIRSSDLNSPERYIKYNSRPLTICIPYDSFFPILGDLEYMCRLISHPQSTIAFIYLQ